MSVVRLVSRPSVGLLTQLADTTEVDFGGGGAGNSLLPPCG